MLTYTKILMLTFETIFLSSQDILTHVWTICVKNRMILLCGYPSHVLSQNAHQFLMVTFRSCVVILDWGLGVVYHVCIQDRNWHRRLTQLHNTFCCFKYYIHFTITKHKKNLYNYLSKWLTSETNINCNGHRDRWSPNITQFFNWSHIW